jgi:hypothetical protein
MTNADILDAAEKLSSVCDGAISQDSPFVKSVLAQEFPPTPKQIAALFKILQTYKVQLSGMGIEYADLELEPTSEEKTPKSIERRHQVDPSWKDFKIYFGKYKGESLYQIFIDDPQYLKWIAENFSDGDVKSSAIAILSDKYIKKDDVIDSTVTLDYKNGKVVITSPFEAKFL